MGSSTTRWRVHSCITPCLGGRSSLAPDLWLRCVCFQSYRGTKVLTASQGKEYALADSRWGVSDPTVVSLELLTVFGVGTMCFYVIKQLVQNDPARHYWIIVLSTSEIYGG